MFFGLLVESVDENLQRRDLTSTTFYLSFCFYLIRRNTNVNFNLSMVITRIPFGICESAIAGLQIRRAAEYTTVYCV